MMNLAENRLANALSGCLAFGLVAVLCSGCQSGLPDRTTVVETLDVRDKLGWKSEEEPPPPQIPSRLVATWTHAVRHTRGKPAERGFGGRIVFFGRDMEEPVRVDGQLVVYAFDEDGRKEYETQPTKRYIFPAEQFARHEGESALGASYSVWIPWDDVGGPQKNISLITRFEPAGGAIVVGEQTRHLLPGATQQLAAAAPSKDERSVVLASHDQSESEQLNAAALSGGQTSQPAASTQQPSAATTTIQLPDNLKQRLQRIRTQQTRLREIQKNSSANYVKQSSQLDIQRAAAPSHAESERANQPSGDKGDDSEQAGVPATSVGRYVQGFPARGLATKTTHFERPLSGRPTQRQTALSARPQRESRR